MAQVEYLPSKNEALNSTTKETTENTQTPRD
jgi:hypothetical protein